METPSQPAGPAGSRTVVIADDHVLIRNALCEVFNGIDGAEVTGQAEDGLAALTLCKTLKPALLTLDSAMPLARGMEVFGEVRRWAPDTRICLITGFTAQGHLADWIAAGVDGATFKSCPTDEMRAGFELIFEGGSFFSKAVMAALDGENQRPTLTLRERQILHLIAEGCGNAEIAERLTISPKTVDNHRTRLMSKLGVHSVAQLLAYALREGLLDQNAQL